MAHLHVPVWGWVAVVGVLAILLCVDFVASTRRTTPVRMSQAAGWTLVTVLLAVGFGALLAVTSGGTPAGQFFAGWLTEYSLSLDNLLVFVILISRSRVPARLHGRVLLAGIGIAVVLRGIVIGLGAAALHRFGWLEFLFAGFLLYTAAQIARRGGTPIAAEAGAGQSPAGGRPASADGLPGTGGAPEPEAPGGIAARVAAWLTRRHGSVPVLALVAALGVVDVMFAFDSIPAIFGLTRDPFLVFSANVFALIGLRHLYFLVAGLLSRLVYLQTGLCIILAFIGAKLLGEALRGVGVTKLGPIPVPQVSSWLSLAIIILVLATTAVASVLATRRRARKAQLPGPAACDGQR
jgi:predicted tellurium resistance membrane protein TerC